MKRGWMLVLLISLGLNLGLGLRLVTGGGETTGRRLRDERSSRPWPARGDTAAWRARMGARFDHMAHGLGLDPDQQAHFKAHHEAALGEVMARRGELAESRTRLRETLGATPLDPAAVRGALAAVAAAQAAMDSLIVEKMLTELEYLTPAQQEEYLRMLPLESMGAGRGHRHGPEARGGGRGGRHGGRRQEDGGG